MTNDKTKSKRKPKKVPTPKNNDWLQDERKKLKKLLEEKKRPARKRKPRNRKPVSNRKQEYLRYLNSKRWDNVKKIVRERDGHCCQNCGRSDMVLHVHHLTYEHFKDELNHLEDLITLCEVCHNEIHWKKATTKFGK